MAKNLLKVINDALAAHGYKHTKVIGPTVRVVVDTKVATIFHGDIRDDYFESAQKIPGVLHDEGQADGYEFDIDFERYTPKSEERLMKLVADFAKRDAELENEED